MAKAKLSLAAKRKNCNKGWNCGATCITKKKLCRKLLSKDNKDIVIDYGTLVKIVEGKLGKDSLDLTRAAGGGGTGSGGSQPQVAETNIKENLPLEAQDALNNLLRLVRKDEKILEKDDNEEIKKKKEADDRIVKEEKIKQDIAKIEEDRVIAEEKQKQDRIIKEEKVEQDRLIAEQKIEQEKLKTEQEEANKRKAEAEAARAEAEAVKVQADENDFDSFKNIPDTENAEDGAPITRNFTTRTDGKEVEEDFFSDDDEEDVSKVFKPKGVTELEYQVGDNTIEAETNTAVKSNRDSIYDITDLDSTLEKIGKTRDFVKDQPDVTIDLFVNESPEASDIDQVQGLSVEDTRKRVNEATKKAVQEIVDSYEDGTIFVANPEDENSNKTFSADIFKKEGFGETGNVFVTDDILGNMSAIKVDGKLVPISIKTEDKKEKISSDKQKSFKKIPDTKDDPNAPISRVKVLTTDGTESNKDFIGDGTNTIKPKGIESIKYKVGDNEVDSFVTSDTKTNREDLFNNTKLEQILTNLGKTKDDVLDQPEVNIDFTVNGNFEVESLNPINGSSERQTSIRVALAARAANQELMDSYEDGTIFVANPFDGDGKGESRKKAYKNAGFGDTTELEILGGMSAIKIDGKIIPIEPDNTKITPEERDDFDLFG